jgi:hypothetical protein
LNIRPFAENQFDEREKIVRQASENKLSLAEMNLPIGSPKTGVRTLVFD